MRQLTANSNKCFIGRSPEPGSLQAISLGFRPILPEAAVIQCKISPFTDLPIQHLKLKINLQGSL